MIFAPGSIAFADGGPRFPARLRMVAAGALPPARWPHVGRAPLASDGKLRVSVRMKGGARALSSLGFQPRAAFPSAATSSGASSSSASGADAQPEETVWLDVDRDQLAALHDAPGVISVEPGLVLRPSLDRSLPAASVPAARADLGLDGAGVVVGLVDTGLDFRHRDFRAADGTTRVLSLLDVSIANTHLHPELPDYQGGSVWLQPDIDAQLAADAAGQVATYVVAERDTDGHGTHVAGIATSAGLATGNGLPAGRYVGVAPAVSIVAVKATRGDGFFDEDVLSGVQFVFDRAAAARLPAVVNLSLSAEGGPHDGTGNFERALSALAPEDAAGRAIVVAAGNDGGHDHHAGGWALDGAVEIDLTYPGDADSTASLSVDLWLSGAPTSITLVTPSGKTYGPALDGAMLDGDDADPDGHVILNVASGGADPLNGRFEAAVNVAGNRGLPVGGGTWKLILSGDCPRWDAWLTGTGGATDPRFLDHLDEDQRAEIPAYARSVISVGSFVSRNAWLTDAGEAVTRPTVVGQPSSFSGTGPTADGLFLPDLAAPGDFILSALSQDAPPDEMSSSFYVPADAHYLIADDGQHGALRGTSQAAPHVAGTVALLLQVDPTLTPARLRELLRTSADLDAGEPGYSTRQGFGRLDVFRAGELLLRQPSGPVDAARSSVGASRDLIPPGTLPVEITVVPRDAKGQPLGPSHTVTIDSDAGTFDAPVSDAGEGRYHRTLRPTGKNSDDGTVATLTVTVDGVTLLDAPHVYFTTNRGDVGAGKSLGCAVDNGRGSSARATWLVLAPLACALRRRRRSGVL